MKERLQKDLRFINKWFIRLIISAIIGALITAIIDPRYNREEQTYFIVSTGVVYLLLYILSAWLYPPGDNK